MRQNVLLTLCDCALRQKEKSSENIMKYGYCGTICSEKTAKCI
nr:MAG TPA: hypothetical protein [Caudoviricetes sp.]